MIGDNISALLAVAFLALLLLAMYHIGK